MQRIRIGLITATSVAALMALSTAGPAAAQVVGPRIAAPLAVATSAAVTPVQWRRRAWGGRRVWAGRRVWGPRRFWGPRRYYYRRGWGWGWWGWPAAGFATGLVVGSALAAPYAYGYPYGYRAAPVYDDAIAYCVRRFKSYDLRTRTYLGYDGYRHPCP